MPGRRRHLRVLFIEPFHGGSHRLFAERVAALSRHRVETLTLPGSFWKWRMRGAHLSLLEKVRARIPKVVYLHESQLSYPVPAGVTKDVHFGFTNLSTALAADRLVFNSRFHREEFLGGIAEFLKPLPDHRPAGLADELRRKSAVVYPGVDCSELERHRHAPDRAGRPATILWNHRWEFDKQPEVFFRALGELAAEGIPFRVHIAGESFKVRPQSFLAARERLGDRVATFGHVPRREDYIRVLWDSDIVVSTAIQEFFGIAVMEAAYCGARPLLPARLAFPELYPREYLYGGDTELTGRLRALVMHGVSGAGGPETLRAALQQRFDVGECVATLDDLLERLVPAAPPAG